MKRAALSEDDRLRLARLLEMISSDRDPDKRSAASAAARRIVQQAGLTWRQVLNPPAVEHKLPEMGTWRRTCAACLEHPGSLRPHERVFLTELQKFRRLSPKQRCWLKEIADRVLGG